MFDSEVLPRAARYMSWVPLEFLRLVLPASTAGGSQQQVDKALQVGAGCDGRSVGARVPRSLRRR